MAKSSYLQLLSRYLAAKDGDADLIEVWQDGGVYKSTSWINNGQGSYSIGSITDFVGGYRNNTQYLTGDVDKDGDADLSKSWGKFISM